jgi:hypothetical protein
LKSLLLWGTIVAVPQVVPLLFIHSVTGALIAAVPIGLMGGIASASYLDLIIRSCPRGLQGTTLMMASGLYFVASRFGDVLGTILYEYYGGLAICVIAITVVYAGNKDDGGPVMLTEAPAAVCAKALAQNGETKHAHSAQ